MAAATNSQIIDRLLKAAFPQYRPNIEVRRRRKDDGYNLTFTYHHADGLEPPNGDDIYRAISDGLAVIDKDGNRTKLSLDDVRRRFAVKLCGIGKVEVYVGKG